MDEQVGSAVEDASGRIRQVVQRVQALCQMERAGDMEKMHQHSADEPDMEHLIIDSTTVRAHPCAAGAPHKKGTMVAGSWEKSRGFQHESACEC